MTDFKNYKLIAESITKLLHPFAEVVLHDIKKNQIVEIFNSFTKRRAANAAGYAAKVLGVSRATIYNYLNEAHISQ